ncbi:MAG TPA: ABC transporter substrate-binding protein, partial [Pyrinomonadaceae bacterium]|nr:ABC transporter substrate-binding protein [Pyrinomonadaceae bacterium]
MSRSYRTLRNLIAVGLIASVTAGCFTQASSKYFGETVAPKENVLRYVSGSEPESLDPAVSNSQPDARIDMALYDGLIEYEPKTLEAIPAIAESWEVLEGGTEYIFHLRKNARFSDGSPITAHDFVFTLRRGFSPELASRNASLGYYIKYSEAYNAGRLFVKAADGTFLLKKDFSDSDAAGAESSPPAASGNDFHSFLDGPERLTLPESEKDRAKALDANPKLKAAVEGKEFVPAKAEDIGVEAVDDYTLRIKL